MVNTQLIKEWFEKSGLSKEAFAVHIDRSLSTVNNLLSGKAPELETLENVAQFMGKKLEELLIRSEDRKAG